MEALIPFNARRAGGSQVRHGPLARIACVSIGLTTWGWRSWRREMPGLPRTSGRRTRPMQQPFRLASDPGKGALAGHCRLLSSGPFGENDRHAEAVTRHDGPGPCRAARRRHRRRERVDGTSRLGAPLRRGRRRGTIVVVDERARRALGPRRGAGPHAVPPASTFKVPHALFALDAGVVRDEFQVVQVGRRRGATSRRGTATRTCARRCGTRSCGCTSSSRADRRGREREYLREDRLRQRRRLGWRRPLLAGRRAAHLGEEQVAFLRGCTATNCRSASSTSAWSRT